MAKGIREYNSRINETLTYRGNMCVVVSWTRDPQVFANQLLRLSMVLLSGATLTEIVPELAFRGRCSFGGIWRGVSLGHPSPRLRSSCLPPLARAYSWGNRTLDLVCHSRHRSHLWDNLLLWSKSIHGRPPRVPAGVQRGLDAD